MNHRLLTWATLVGLLYTYSAGAQQTSDWQAEIRERVAAKRLGDALSIAEQRLADAPEDSEARGWHARLLAWSGRWREAEDEYLRVLEAAPHDVDILVGLANVLSWQQRYTQALAILDQAQQLDPKRSDVYVGQGRDYLALGRTQQARQAFLKALDLDPSSAEAKAGLASLAEELRYELRFGTDMDTFNYADTGWTHAIGLHSRISPQWSVDASATGLRRFGENAERFLSNVAYRFTSRDWFTIGGGAAHDQGVVPKSEGFLEYGHGFRMGKSRVVRGVEASYHQHWFWYQGARSLVLTPSVLFYLPHEWAWSIQVSAARSRIVGLPAEWHPSGLTRLNFPLHGPLGGNVFYAVGTENFALVDQIGRFSARTFGGGLRYRFTRRQGLAGYVSMQDRSQGRSQTSFGLSYAIRF